MNMKDQKRISEKVYVYLFFIAVVVLAFFFY